ncbi:outer membrane protein assembly factor BamA [Holospora curviuscula]|uniref:Outer membrane protein assembly factor BamA n=1 Tax=Holospora curviuscula TaxID=1082868 RepID=A0A2S5RDG3_9PROT|nr:outer membrane protein assembly factor BamA [Holospora curviuscula]PPE05338.1 Outer membrane protein assembly factor BamA precursor [Holospora curviuscula]
MKPLNVVFLWGLLVTQEVCSVDSVNPPSASVEPVIEAPSNSGGEPALGKVLVKPKNTAPSSEPGNSSNNIDSGAALPPLPSSAEVESETEGDFYSNQVAPEALESFRPAKPDMLPKKTGALFPETSVDSLQDKKIIREVNVVGIRRVDRQAILDHLPEHTSCTQAELDVFVKNLFNSGLFKEVSVFLENSVLTVRVQENPSIAEVRFEGNDKISRSDLKEESTLQPRDIFSKESVSNEVKRVVQLYSNKGYYAVKVRPLIQRLKQNRVNIIFHIEEGHRSYNKQIRFLMDAKDPGFSESALRDVITSLEDRWWRILGDPAECYDKARVEYDCDLLRKHYYRNGYLDVRVTAHTQLAKNREHFYITFFIHEGPQYCISDIKIKSDLKNLNLDGLETHITLKKGSVFNAEMPEKVASRMAQELEMRGLSFLEVRPVINKNELRKEVSLCFLACKAPVVYAGKVFVKGNYATNDEIIRRMLKFSEGDPLSMNKVNSSKEMLESMDFFESIDIKPVASADPKIQDVTLEVKEKGTGDVKFSGGYSTQDGIIGQIGLEERNLFGRALYGNLSAMVAQHGMDFRVGMANPFSFGRNLTLGGTLFYNRFRSTTKGSFSGEGAYKQSAGGADVYARYPLSQTLSQFWGYSIHADHVSHFSPYMSPYIWSNMQGKYNILNASVEHKLEYGKTNVENGEYVSGSGVQWSTVLHGVGGEVKCLKNIIMATHYIPLNSEKTLLLKFEAQGGFIHKMGYMRFSDQFTLGLFSFPGFRFSGLGPRDERTGDALFARCYYTASAKLYWGLGFLGIPKDTPLRAVVFAYTGSLWNSIFGKQDNNAYILSPNFQNRASCGVGLIWTLPMMGNIGFLFSKPVQRQDWDQTQNFLFVWGQSF